MQPLIRRVREADWAVARTLRLRALLDSPEAFASTWAEENALADAQWQSRARSNAEGRVTAGFFALLADMEVGLAVGVRRDQAVELNALWVAPEARRHGAGRALIEAVAGWAREVGVDELVLEVTHTSEAALALYRASGFSALPDPGSCGTRRAPALKMRRLVGTECS